MMIPADSLWIGFSIGFGITLTALGIGMLLGALIRRMGKK